MPYKTGEGKSGRLNATDARYSCTANPHTTIAVPEWVGDMLAKMAKANRISKSEMASRIIEKAGEATFAACLAMALGMGLASCLLY